MDRENVWKSYTSEQQDQLNQVNEKYKVCLDAGKTERECVKLAKGGGGEGGLCKPGGSESAAESRG